MRLPLYYNGITQGLHQYNAYDFGWHERKEKYFNEYAVADAIVYNVYTSATGGNIVTLRINAGEDFVWATYKHCAKIYVKKGQEVKEGELIAYMGATGNATGEHLHLELAKAPKHIAFENSLAFEKKYAMPYFDNLYAYEGQLVSKNVLTSNCNIKCVEGCHYEDYVIPETKANVRIVVKNKETPEELLKKEINELNRKIAILESDKKALEAKKGTLELAITNAKNALEKA